MKRTIKLTVLLFCAIWALAACSSAAPASRPTEQPAMQHTGETPPDETSENAADTVSGGEGSMTLSVDGTMLDIAWADNESVDALKEILQNGGITVSTEQYGGFEQVGALPQSLPKNDTQITTRPGDIALYAGRQLVLFYGSNSWAYTPLGHINGLSDEELRALLGNKSVDITLFVK